MALDKRWADYVCTAVAGTIFLGETLFGCIAVLGIGFNNVQDIIGDICLTMSFPIFLIFFRHRAFAVVGLWLFFVVQWVDLDIMSRPPLLNPLNDWHSDLLFAGISILTFAYFLFPRRTIVEA